MNLDEATQRARTLFGPTEPPNAVPMIELGRREGQGQGFFGQLDAMTPQGFPIPALLWFGLTELLGLKDEGPEEKVLWSVFFCSNGITYGFEHRKFGLRMLCEQQHIDNPTTKQVLGKTRGLTDIVESYLSDTVAMSQVRAGNFTMENLFAKLDERYRFLREQAEAAYSRPPPPPEQGTTANGGWYSHDIHRPVREGGALGTAAVDAYFSRSEHIFCLVVAFQDAVPSTGFLELLASNWRIKAQQVLDLQDPTAKSFYDRFLTVREEWRNPLAHGGFLSGGSSLHFHLPRIGALPARLRRTPEGPRLGFRLAQQSFDEIVKLFDEFDEFLKTGPLRLPFRWVDAGLDVAFDESSRQRYRAAMESDSGFEHFLDGTLRRIDMEMNMDW
jgi:hypothetical protein